MVNLTRILVIFSVILVTGCASNEVLENTQNQDDKTQAIASIQGVKDAQVPHLTINDGIVYIRRSAKNQLIEMVFDINNPKLDLQIELSPLTSQLPVEQLPASNSIPTENDKQIASSYFINAQGYFLNREYKRALVEINRAINEQPKSAISWALKGSIHYRRNENGLARQAWQQSLQLNPDNVRVQDMLKNLGS